MPHRPLRPPRLPWRSDRLRTRLVLGFVAVLALATLNIGAFYWGARQRARVFRELTAAIAQQGALTEARVQLEDHYKRVKVMSDLLGVERGRLGAEERERTLRSIDAFRRGLAAPPNETAPPDPRLARVRAGADSLATSWMLFYEQQATDPTQALAEVVLVAEPLAQRLLAVELPAAANAQRRRVNAASAAFVRTDRLSSELMWAILVLTGVVSAVLLYGLSRDLLRAVGALKLGAERFGAGELAHQVAVTRCEELAEVGESLNAMARRLRQARDELEVRNQELAQLAFRDPLTQLANRALFRERVEHALTVGHRRPQDLSVLFIDLDDFKSVNDTLGHAEGDRLLVDVAERLLSATRGSDTVARLGGDEFAIMLHRVRGVEEAILVAQRVVASMQAPFALGGRAVRVTTSVGVACGTDGCAADEMLRNADVAMYRAKGAGKGRYEVFAPEMHAALLDRVELEAELREALGVGREELVLAYQPIVDIATRRISSFEALVRWRHPRRGLVSPAQFVPLAEESDLILRLGRWVLETACREAARWQAPGRHVGISVNVSGRQLDDPSLLGDVRHALDDSGLDPQCLTLEITETVIMRDSTSTLTRLRELKALGVRVAIDDFGTGYSSLAYLQRFPVDVLKIDKAFVDQVARGGNDAAIARTIVALAEMLHLRTVAEGIEHEEQRAGLQMLGCQLGQGYLFARPLSADAAREALATMGERAAA